MGSISTARVCAPYTSAARRTRDPVPAPRSTTRSSGRTRANWSITSATSGGVGEKPAPTANVAKMK